MTTTKPRDFWIIREDGNLHAYTDEGKASAAHSYYTCLDDNVEVFHLVEASALLAKDQELKALGEMYREQIQLHGKERSENARLRELLNRFKVFGTDDCSECETGRITLFYAEKKCIECDPDSYMEIKALSGGEV
jgi:hypothetical protein